MAKGKRKVVVRITSDVAGLKKGVFEADLTLKNFAKTSRAAANVAGKMLAGGAAAAATGLAAIYAKTAPLIDANAKLADRLGMTTEALAGLHLAGELAGVGTETLNKSLERMNRSVGDALSRGGETARVFEQLGLSAQELAGMSADQQMRVLSEAISGLGTQAEKAAAANMIFGRSGQQMLNMMEGGAASLDEAERKAIAYGAALSRVDAAKVEAANDAMTEAQSAIQGIFNRITVQLAPAVEMIAEMFTSAADESEGFKDEVGQGFDVLVEGAALAANALRGVEVIWKGLEVVAAGFTGVVASVFEVVGKIMTKSLDGWRMLINNWIEIANNIPGVDIDLIGDGALQKANQFFTDVGESARENVGIVRGELHDLLMEPLPGDELKKQIAETYAKAEEAAREATAGSGGNEDSAGGLTPQEQARIEKLRESLLTEEQLEIESHKRRIEEINRFSDELFETEAEKKAAMQTLEDEHQKKLKDIRDKGMTDIEKLSASSWSNQAQYAMGQFQQMTAGLATHSKTMFKINKAASLAMAALKIPEAASSAYAWGAAIGGPPLGALSAGLAVAAQVAQMRAIQAQSFGSGRGAPSQVGQPSVPVHDASGRGARTDGSGGQSGGGQGQDIVYNVRGDVFGRDAITSIIDGINQAVADGATIRSVRVT